MKRLVTGLLALSVLVSAMLVVHHRHLSRKAFVELQAMQNQRDEYNVEWGRLQLEQATLADGSRVEQVARSQLGLVSKPPAKVVVSVE